MQFPAYHRATEFIAATPLSFTVLASIAPVTSVNNRASTISSNGTTWTTTKSRPSRSPVAAPIVGVRTLDGLRIRDVHFCHLGVSRPALVAGVEQ